MDDLKGLIEIGDYKEEGNAPVIDFESWRVARTNYSKQTDKENIAALSKHFFTDEVFVLLEGKAVLIVASGESKAEQIHCINMDKVKIYNVKKDVFHALVTTKDGKILIVENKDTSIENSKAIQLTDGQVEHIKSEINKYI